MCLFLLISSILQYMPAPSEEDVLVQTLRELCRHAVAHYPERCDICADYAKVRAILLEVWGEPGRNILIRIAAAK